MKMWKKNWLGLVLVFAMIFGVMSASTTEAASRTYNLASMGKNRQITFTVTYKGSIFKKNYWFKVINRGNGASANVFVYRKLAAGGNQYLTNINGGHEQTWSGQANRKFSETYIVNMNGGGKAEITVETSDNLSIS